MVAQHKRISISYYRVLYYEPLVNNNEQHKRQHNETNTQTMTKLDNTHTHNSGGTTCVTLLA